MSDLELLWVVAGPATLLVAIVYIVILIILVANSIYGFVIKYYGQGVILGIGAILWLLFPFGMYYFFRETPQKMKY